MGNWGRLIVITHDVASVLSILPRFMSSIGEIRSKPLIPGIFAGVEHPARAASLRAQDSPEDRPALPASSTPFIEVKDVRKTYAGPGFFFRGKVTNVLDRVCPSL